MKNKIVFIAIIILVFMILLIPLKGSYAFYSDNKDLSIINTKVGNFRKTELEKYLRSNDENNNLSKYIVGDMYRYQGTDNVANWICFGTTENCGANDELIDKYMYRIIGITKEGQLKLLKETFLKEGSIIKFSWNDETRRDAEHENSCSDGKCPEWNDADLFYRINGTANGTHEGSGNFNDNINNNTDIFIDSKYYDYLKSGDNDGVNGSDKASEWYNLISDHDWMYGDTTQTYYNGDQMYEIETGQTETIHYIRNSEGSAIVEEQYKWPVTNKVTAKISLMYLHDVLYAYPGGNPENNANVANSWIHFRKDGYNFINNLDRAAEWLSTRWGGGGVGAVNVGARFVLYDGILFSTSYGLLSAAYGVRPVFYLNSNIMITKGNGTKTNPFIINN